ncbi:MAG: type secretion system protein VirB3 [Aliidongia sp.]|nr:type secretion system protein VirB3 [Aliidongia sp.]
MERLDEDTLYLAATRPALVGGVPLAIAGLLMMAAGLIIVILQNPLYEMLMGPLWFGAKAVVSRDYNAVNVLVLYLTSAGRSIDSGDWGGATLSPNPIRVGPRGRGMACCLGPGLCSG